jgi:hypothetical protein
VPIPNQSTYNWTKYREKARQLKTAKPQITPTGIRLVLGEPHIDGRPLEITSDGQGGIKQRNRGLHRILEMQRQIRLRKQTPRQDAAQKREIKAFKEELRSMGYQVDHINEVAVVGAQLERLEKIGGMAAVERALEILHGAGYETGNMKGNLQGLTPADNVAKRDEWKDLQAHLGRLEQLNRSPSAGRTDLIVTADPELEETLKGTPQKQVSLPQTTAAAPRQNLTPQSSAPQSKVTPPQAAPEPKVNMAPQVMSAEKNGNGNGNGAYETNGNGNGNGGTYLNGNGNGNGNYAEGIAQSAQFFGQITTTAIGAIGLTLLKQIDPTRSLN